MVNYYAAYQIDEASRQQLQDIFKPKYPEVVAHHITHKYGAGPEDVPAPPRNVRVVGCHDTGAIQVLAVEIDGRRHQETAPGADRKYYHITFSLDRAQGVSPSKSNAALRKIAAEQGEEAIYNLPQPVDIKALPKLLLDPPTFEEASQEAAEILSHKTLGPNGIIAYAVVNDEKVRADGTPEPFFNPASQKPLKLAYAFFETDRTGVPVISAPGGTQDVVATNPLTGQTLEIELTKESALRKALAIIGADVPNTHDTDKLEHYALAKFIEKGWQLKIEDSFTAAVREAKEEQGIDLTSPASYIGAPQLYDRNAITKRTIDRIEKIHRAPLFDIRNVNSIADLKGLTDDIRAAAPPAVSAEAPQRLFAIQVPGFGDATPVNLPDKIESKIQGREGARFYEKGRFVTLEQMAARLDEALPVAKAEQDKGNPSAGREIVATYERLQIFRRIEAGLAKQLRAQGIAVTTDVPFADADKPDNIVAEYAGTARLPEGLKKLITPKPQQL